MIEKVNTDERIRLTADAINNAFRATFAYAPLIFTFIDSLQLLQFRPCSLRIEKIGLRSLPPQECKVLCIPDKEENIDTTLGLTAACTQSVDALRRCCDELRTRYPDAYNAVRQGVSSFRKVTDRPTVRSAPLEVDAAKQILNPFVERHRSLMKSVESAPWRGDRPLELFSVVRYRAPADRRTESALLAYTAQIVLTPGQQNAAERFETGAAKILETPLGGSSTAVVDTCYSTGLIDCGRPSPEWRDGRDAPKTSCDKARYDIEARIYRDIYEIKLGEEWRSFYVPVHVNGTPWLAFYRLVREEGDWEDAYWYYRSLVPQLAASVRNNAREAYFEVLQSIASGALSQDLEWSECLRFMNGSWQNAASVYPFPCPRLSESSEQLGPDASCSEVFFGGRNMTLSVGSELAEWANCQVDFDPVTPREVLERTHNTLSRLLERSLKRSQLLFGYLHETGNALSETGWQGTLRLVEQSSTLDSKQIQAVRACLRKLERPQALIGALRSVAKVGAQGELSWLDPNFATRPLSEFIDQYQQSIEWLVDYICAAIHIREGSEPGTGDALDPASNGRPGEQEDLRVTNTTLSEMRVTGLQATWRAARRPYPPPWPPPLAFPPIKLISSGDSEATHAVWTIAALLSEPIRNAAKALRAQRVFTGNPLLLAWSVAAADEEITVNITNTLTDISEKALKSVGLELTNFVGNELCIGSIAAPEVIPLFDGKVASVQIQLYPQRLKLRRF